VSRHTFRCIDGHTAGNPVRLVVEGAPQLRGGSMSELRQDFMARYDWIRRGLMFEPRGHDMMSGGFLYPPFEEGSDAAILFMETSGCLPMCGHGTIGMITFGLEAGLIRPREEGRLRVEVPAGLLEVAYGRKGDKVDWVRLTNVPSFVAAEGVEVELPEIGRLSADVAYGGNFYAIIEPQGGYAGLDAMGADKLARLGRELRARVREAVEPVHPENPTIRGVSHVLWADRPKGEGADGRNAVFYGEKAIDRSPCGTGTSARLAHLWSKGRLRLGDRFVHESYIGSRFIGGVEAETTVGGRPAILPSVQGSAWQTGMNTLCIDDEEPFPEGFTVI
jgi:4-hydroxyproline epimerase